MDHNDVVAAATRLTAELASHVRDAFGPMGKHVIVVDDVGKVTLTKNGLQILKALRCVDPLARMIIPSIEKHAELTGDGSKTFIILFSALLSSICADASGDPSSRRQKLTEARLSLMALRRFLWSRRDFIRRVFAERGIPFDGDMKTISRLFSSHLRSGSTVKKNGCERVANLLARFVLANKNGTRCFTGDLDFIVKNFSHFCVREVGRSIENSRLLSALLLSRSVTSNVAFSVDKGKKSNNAFLIDDTSLVSSREPDSDDQNLEIRDAITHPSAPLHALLLVACPLCPNQSDHVVSSSEWHYERPKVVNHLAYRSRNLVTVVDRFKRLKVTVVASTGAVLPHEKAALSAAGILCVEHLSPDEMFWIAELCNCRLVLDIGEIFLDDVETCLVDFTDARVVKVNGEERLLLRDLRLKNSCAGIQLILSSPTAATCESLERAAIASVKHFRSMVSQTDDPSILLACGGFFEVFLASTLQSSISQNPSDSSCSSNHSSSTDGESSLRQSISSASQPITNELQHPSSQKTDILDAISLRNGVRFLCDALLYIPSVIHRNSISSGNGDGRFLSVLRAFEGAVSDSSAGPPKFVGIDAKSGLLFQAFIPVLDHAVGVQAESSDSGVPSRTPDTAYVPSSLTDEDSSHCCETLDRRFASKKTFSCDFEHGAIPSVEIENCDLESYDEKMTAVLGVLDLAITLLNIETTVIVKNSLAVATDDLEDG